MRKFNVELTEEQLKFISKCLEDICHLATGKHSMEYCIQEILNSQNLDFNEYLRKDIEIGNLFEKIKDKLIEDNKPLSFKSNVFIGNVYQMFKTMNHYLDRNENLPLESGNLGKLKIVEIVE